MWYVYILRCADKTLYTGICKDLERRLKEHNTSPLGAKYTKSRRPVQLVWSQEVADRANASRLEYHIKRMGKSRKEEIIVGKKTF